MALNVVRTLKARSHCDDNSIFCVIAVAITNGFNTLLQTKVWTTSLCLYILFSEWFTSSQTLQRESNQFKSDIPLGRLSYIWSQNYFIRLNSIIQTCEIHKFRISLGRIKIGEPNQCSSAIDTMPNIN